VRWPEDDGDDSNAAAKLPVLVGEKFDDDDCSGNEDADAAECESFEENVSVTSPETADDALALCEVRELRGAAPAADDKTDADIAGNLDELAIGLGSNMCGPKGNAENPNALEFGEADATMPALGEENDDEGCGGGKVSLDDTERSGDDDAAAEEEEYCDENGPATSPETADCTHALREERELRGAAAVAEDRDAADTAGIVDELIIELGANVRWPEDNGDDSNAAAKLPVLVGEKCDDDEVE
jgi:hypothetical protein